ncbi:rhomboid family intramembrane serine protease [Dysgonomonas macrotermitis]|uniref:Rhomboid family protein n=1 Tax=Dysgonomonas macrotermitis TaxID=1346286 RepID=A0A1M5FII8_9BACT|nr:rhomboid family intramembrane serine protease [Dysgonomonas macrotermitis]SHF91315.1 Rhomboid family protein [Dysgonomonas macrotermitis]
MDRYKKNSILQAAKYSFIFVVIFWIIEAVQYVGIDLSTWGILPRSVNGLVGILTSPFIHGDWEHLIANTLPFFVLSTILLSFYKRNASMYFILLWITTGILTWIIGRGAWHIGASGVIYALASFLVFGGIASRNWKLILLSIIVAFMYSGLVWGVFPQDTRISWEGHLSGAISGLIWAYLCRKSLRVKSNF